MTDETAEDIMNRTPQVRPTAASPADFLAAQAAFSLAWIRLLNPWLFR